MSLRFLRPEDKLAKRKLSLEQRATVRKEIRQSLTKKKKPAEILRAVAAKYGVSIITARWYLKSVLRPGKPVSARKPKGRHQASGRQARRRTRVQPANGAAMRFVHQVQAIAEKSFKRVVEVKKLIPKWQVYVRKEASLRQLENRVKTQLRAISTKVAALHRRIQALTPK